MAICMEIVSDTVILVMISALVVSVSSVTSALVISDPFLNDFASNIYDGLDRLQ